MVLGRELVRAELVATVLEVLVAEGDTVRAGQELVVVESMKMEIPVLPEGGGTVVDVAVSAGDVVQAGDVLVVVERAQGVADPVTAGCPEAPRRPM